MTTTARPRLLPTLMAAVVAVLLCPLAAADAGRVTAEKASYHGGADQHGDLAAFFLLAGADPTRPDDATLAIDIRAGRMEALQVERHYLVGTQVGEFAQPVDDPRYDPATPPARTVLDKARATLVAQQDAFQVHLIPTDPAQAIAFTAHTDAGMFTQYETLIMDVGRFAPARPAPLDEDNRRPDLPEFWAVRIDEPLVVHDDQASQFQAHFIGDMVLEVMGGTFEAQDHDESATLESGVWLEPAVDAGIPLPAGVDAQRRVMLRLFLEDAVVDVRYQGATTDAKWASKSIASKHGGDATLEGASGEISSDGDVILLQNDRYVLPAGTMLTMTPDAPATMVLDIQPAVAPATAGADADLGNDGTALAGIVAILALLVAAGIGLTRRLSSIPALREVELALESERYGRAARIAKRILRARPGLEDAVLGRAIALSKAGRAGAAISEIHEQLATRGASDGSLHYVLGLSFLDVGRSAEAGIALHEAVRRTPALQADVASRLGHLSDSHPATLREVHGYA